MPPQPSTVSDSYPLHANMHVSAADRALRGITIFALIPCLAFMIPFSMNTHTGIAALCAVPVGFSALSGLFQLNKRVNVRSVNIFLDVAMAWFLIGTLIPACIMVEHAADVRYNGSKLAMVGAYGTIPSMVNFCIHTYFAMRETHVFEGIRLHLANLSFSPTCPHCQREVLFSRSSPGSTTSRQSYGPVTMHDDDVEDNAASSKLPRDSVGEYKDDARRSTEDDEAAHLV